MATNTTLTPFHRAGAATAHQRVTAVSKIQRAISRATQLLTGRSLHGIAFAGAGFVAIALDVDGVPARLDVRLYDDETGVMVGHSHTDEHTGLLTFHRLPIGLRYRVETEDAHGAGFNAVIWDGLPSD